MTNSAMTPRQLDAQISATVRRTMTQLAREERAETAMNTRNTPFTPLPAAAATPRPKGEIVARMVRALAASRGVPELAAKWVIKHYNDEISAKALSASRGASGGFLIPGAFSSEVIELLRPASVIMSLDPVRIEMPHGNLTIPAVAGGAWAEYTAEQRDIPTSSLTLRQVRLSARKLTAMVPISNDILRFASAAADAIVREDIVRAIAQRTDLAFIRGDGAGNSPIGLRYLAPASNVLKAAPADGTSAIDLLLAVSKSLSSLELALLAANVPMSRPGWIMAPRTMVYLMNLRDASGNLVYSDEMSRGTLRGKPFRHTNLSPVNLDTAGNNSEIYLADFADVVVAETGSLLIDVSDTAAYSDGSQIQAPYSRDETVIRAIVQHDIAVRHDPSIAVLTEVNWQ